MLSLSGISPLYLTKETGSTIRLIRLRSFIGLIAEIHPIVGNQEETFVQHTIHALGSQSEQPMSIPRPCSMRPTQQLACKELNHLVFA